MFGTLVGLFITSTAIVVGVDSIVSSDNGPSFPLPIPGKSCQTAVRSVATIQGHYALKLNPPAPVPWLLKQFHQACMSLQKMNVSLREQADFIADSLRAKTLENMPKIDRGYLERRFSTNHQINFVSVSGYENGQPVVEIREVKFDVNADGEWNPVVISRSDMSPTQCKPAFHGEDSVAKKHLKDLPTACPATTEDEAMKLFEDAVRLTMSAPRKMGMKGGYVGGELDVWIISPNGDAQHLRLPEPGQ